MKRFILSIMLFCGLLFMGNAQNVSYSSLNNKDFAKIIQQKKTVLVDVRTAAEYATGHIPNAVNMDVNKPDFEKQVSNLNKKKPVAVYCRSGRRSKVAAQKIAAMGYKVYELDKGIMKWDGEITPKQ